MSGRTRLTRRGRWAAGAVVVVAVVLATNAVASRPLLPAAVTPVGEGVLPLPAPSPTPAPPPGWTPASTVAFDEGVQIRDGVTATAPIVVLSGATPSPTGFDLATWLAVRLAAPVRTVDDLGALAADLERWETTTLVTVGELALDPAITDLVVSVRVVPLRGAALAPPPSRAPEVVTPPAEVATQASVTASPPGPAVRPRWARRLPVIAAAARAPGRPDLVAIDDLLADATPAPAADATALARGATWTRAVTASALGLVTHHLATDDPRADRVLIAALGDAPLARVVLLGDDLAGLDGPTLAWQLATAATGRTLPGGGQLLFPDLVLTALYGHPEGGALGVLGEQGPAAAVARAQELAASYQPHTTAQVVGAFDLIATVASAGPEPTGDYSRRTPIATLLPYVDAASAAGVYTVIDLQPGRTDFLTQAREYEQLLVRPDVGLALDPEWRLGPTQRHLDQIGSVSAAEVNAVATWLAELTRRERLPQKLLLVHQFKLSMIGDRSTIVTHPELAIAIQMDGQGGQGSKDGTYRALTSIDPPAGVFWGWKNFIDEDVPGLRSPAATMAVQPSPSFISIQ